MKVKIPNNNARMKIDFLITMFPKINIVANGQYWQLHLAIHVVHQALAIWE